jgi:predicted deacylase
MADARAAWARASMTLALVCTPSVSTLMAQAPFALGTIRCEGAQRCRGHLELPALAPDSAVRLPVTVLHGGRPGPVLVVTAGIHGSEYAPILAAQRLATLIDPRQLAGTVVLVHVANPPSFFGRGVYYTPGDGKNLNRLFPGRADGTISERLAHLIYHQAIFRATAYIDLHSGDANEALRSYVALNLLGDSLVDGPANRMAVASGFEVAVHHTLPLPLPPLANATTTRSATLSRIPAIAFESGELARTDERYITPVVQGVLQIAHALGMGVGSPAPAFRQTVVATQSVFAPVSGMVRARVVLDQLVEAGDPLADITDLYGEVLVTVRWPRDVCHGNAADSRR